MVISIQNLMLATFQAQSDGLHLQAIHFYLLVVLILIHDFQQKFIWCIGVVVMVLGSYLETCQIQNILCFQVLFLIPFSWSDQPTQIIRPELHLSIHQQQDSQTNQIT